MAVNWNLKHPTSNQRIRVHGGKFVLIGTTTGQVLRCDKISVVATEKGTGNIDRYPARVVHETTGSGGTLLLRCKNAASLVGKKFSLSVRDANDNEMGRVAEVTFFIPPGKPRPTFAGFEIVDPGADAATLCNNGLYAEVDLGTSGDGIAVTSALFHPPSLGTSTTSDRGLATADRDADDANIWWLTFEPVNDTTRVYTLSVTATLPASTTTTRTNLSIDNTC